MTVSAVIIQTHRKGKELRGKCNKGGAHLLSPFGFINTTIHQMRGLYTEAQAELMADSTLY